MPATDEEVEELVKHYDALNKDERVIVLRLLRSMNARIQRTGKPAMSRGYAKCAECGEETLCYSQRGVMRCAKCRRAAAKGGQ